jgi:large subunit ribosomal protein L25
MKAITIEGSVRTETGKKAVKSLRRENMIPCELYGGEENVHFSAAVNAVKDIVYTPNFYKAELHIDGRKYDAVIKDIQFHPVTEALLHIDFLEMVPGKAFKTEVPVRTIGTSLGSKIGGKQMLKTRKLSVKSTPEALKDVVEVDVSELELGQSFKVRDIPDTGMEILNNGSIPVVSIEIPRVLRSAQAAEAAAEAEEALEGEEGEEAAAPAAEGEAPAAEGGAEAPAE